MKDTSKDISNLYNDMLNKLTGQERMQLCSDMFDTARELILASFPKGISEKEKRKLLFLRLYGQDFSEEEKEKILQSL
jgi:hypothetical protein